MRFTLSLLFVSVVRLAEAQQIASPALGYAYDPSLRAIRVIRGLPGAALLEETIDVGLEVTAAEIAPSQDFALIVPTDLRPRLLRLQAQQQPTAALLDAAMDFPDRLIFSPSGSAALLYRHDSGRLQVFTGLPGLPAAHEIPFAPANTMAISDDGAIALAGHSHLRIIGPDLRSFSLPLPPRTEVKALAFSPQGKRNLLVISSDGELYVAKDIHSGLDIRRISYGAALANAVAARFSADGSAALLADSSGVLASVDLESGTSTLISCHCSPTRIEPLASKNLLRVTDISDQPLLLFDTTPNRSRVWFIPTARQGDAQ